MVFLHRKVVLAIVSLCREALLAKHWAATLFGRARLERNLAFGSTLCTNCVVHFARATKLFSLSLVAAGFAALWAAQVL